MQNEMEKMVQEEMEKMVRKQIEARKIQEAVEQKKTFLKESLKNVKQLKSLEKQIRE